MEGDRTPNQQRVIRDLLGWDESLTPMIPMWTHPPDLAERLRAELEERIEPAASRFESDRPLFVSKHHLTSVMKCEGLFLAPSEFEWNVSNVRGKVVHRAIQISIAGRGATLPPLELVHEAVEGFRRGDDALAKFFTSASSADLADIVSASAAAVTTFGADWPPIRPAMIPRIESPVKVSLCEGRVVLKGQYDLALGPPGRGSTIVDLKTGDERPEHREEARYYALLETLKHQVPPLRIASYYLDGSWFQVKDVDEGVLEAALRRTAEGVNRMSELWWRVREPTLTAGPHCHYCPVREECDDGKAWIAESKRDRASLV
jgi:hypothetical protein